MSVRDTPLLNILSWCRNVTPDPYSILVPERDTPILIYYPGTGTWHPIHIFYPGTRTWHPIHIFYPGTGTWHPIHILSWCRNVTPDPLISLLSFIKPSFIPRHHHKQSRLGFSFQYLGFNSFIMLILSQLYNHIHASIQLSI